MRSPLMMLLATAIGVFVLAEACFLVFSGSLALLCTFFWPYFTTSSPIVMTNNTNTASSAYPVTKRQLFEIVMYSSFVYGLAALFALYANQLHMAAFCATTCVSSLLYHWSREGSFFNFDNIFAMSLMFVYLWSMIHSYWNHEIYFNLGILGLPVCTFLISYCGMPADIIVVDEVTGCCIRGDRPFYNMVHSLWHVVSGVGMILAIWYFYEFDSVTAAAASAATTTGAGAGGFIHSSHSMSYTQLMSDYFDQGDVVMGSTFYFDSYGWFPIVPTISFLLSCIINALGNYSGIMPLP